MPSKHFETLDRIVDVYSRTENHEKAARVLAEKATLAVELEDFEMARKSVQEVIETYPDHRGVLATLRELHDAARDPELAALLKE